MTLWKTLRADGSSLREEDRVWYPLPKGDEPGEWITVGGNGAYCVELGGDLFCGGVGKILTQIDTDQEPDCCSEAWLRRELIRCRRLVRIARVVEWVDMPPVPRWCSAVAVRAGLPTDQRWRVILKILEGNDPRKSMWLRWIAEDIRGLTPEQYEMLMDGMDERDRKSARDYIRREHGGRATEGG